MPLDEALNKRTLESVHRLLAESGGQMDLAPLCSKLYAMRADYKQAIQHSGGAKAWIVANGLEYVHDEQHSNVVRFPPSGVQRPSVRADESQGTIPFHARSVVQLQGRRGVFLEEGIFVPIEVHRSLSAPVPCITL